MQNLDQLLDILSPNTPALTATLESAVAPRRARKTAASRTRAERSTDTSAALAVTAALAALSPLDAAQVAAGRAALPPRTELPTVKQARDQVSKPIARPNGELYHPRKLAGRRDVDVLREARTRGLFALLHGRPGAGKTAALEAAFGADLVLLEAHPDLESADIVGSWVQNPDGTFRWVDGPLVVAMREGKVLFVDEIHTLPANLGARLHAALDGRRSVVVREHEGETVIAAPGFYFVAAANDDVPGAYGLTDALRSRLLLQIEVTTEGRLARELGVDDRLVKIAAVMDRKVAAGELSWAPQMREMLAFSRIASAFGVEAACNNLVGTCPPDTRDDLLIALRAWYPSTGLLRLGERA